MTDARLAWDDFCGAARELEASMLRGQGESSESQLRRLLIALNKLDLACLALPNVGGVDDTDEDGPSTYQARLSEVRAAFPEFGPYHYVLPSPNSGTEERVGSDALVDLADILSEIDYALWDASSLGLDEGIWVTQFAYEFRLGSRLAALRSHILYRLFCEPDVKD